MRKYLVPVLLSLLLVFSTAAISIAGNPWTGSAVLTFATDNVATAALALPKNIAKIGIQVPTIETATLKVQVSVDGTTYQDLYCTANTTGVSLLWSTASGTGATNHEVPCEMFLWKYLKIVASAGQTANRTFTIYGVAPIVDTRVP